MPLDPAVQTLLDSLAQMGAPPISEVSTEEARASMLAMVSMMGPGEEVASVEDRTIPVGDNELPIRIYRPEGVPDRGAPALVFFHGGGFVIGSIETHDRDCRALANRGRCVVVSVEYRLAPEHPFPAAADDAEGALAYVAAHADDFGIDAERLAVGGDSAGGNLAANAAIFARDRGIPLVLQLLIYPAVDGAAEDHVYPSRQSNAEGYMLDRASIAWFTERYLPDGEPDDPRAAPIRVSSHAGVAPAFVLTAEFDPLRDEGEAYAQKLSAAGVAAEAKRYDGMIHGFFGMGAIVPAANQAVDEAGAALRQAFGT